MSITDGLNKLEADYKMWQKIDAVKAAVQGFRNEAISTKSNIDMLAQEIIDMPGLFAELPDDIKAVLLAERAIVEASISALENAAIAEHLDWKP